MARPKKKKQFLAKTEPEVCTKPAETLDEKSDSQTPPVSPEILRSKNEIDQAIGCCAVATDADCVTVKSTKASASCDFCGEPSSGRIFVFRQGLELRQGYEKDACAKHRSLSGGPMP